MSRGFIQLHRKIQDEWFWNDPRLVQTMIGLLLRANHEPKEVSFKGEKRLINRGEHITTYRDLANEWGCGRSTVERTIKILVKGDELNLVPTKATHIKVNRYDYFLSDDFVSDAGSKRDEDGTELRLNNNYNNYNNETDTMIEDFQSSTEGIEALQEDVEFKEMLMREFDLPKYKLDDEIYHMESCYETNGKVPKNWKGALKKWLIVRKKFKDGDYDIMMATYGPEM